MPDADRQIYVDNLRVWLTSLVVLHHVAASYGTTGVWYYQEPSSDIASTLFFTFFLAINQSYFMGFFFLLAGYFVPGSLQRKGGRDFLYERFKRLGIPLLVFFFLLNPLTAKLAGHPGWHIGPGPMWFIEVLLVFTLIYVGIRSRLPNLDFPAINKKTSTIFVLTVGVVSYLMRIQWPVNEWFQYLHVMPAHVTQYIGLFALGVWASGSHLAARVPNELPRYWIWLAGIASLAAMLTFIAADTPGDGEIPLELLIGGGSWHSLVIAIWEQALGMAFITTLLKLFHNRLDRRGPILRSASASAYAVYIIHPMVLVVLCSTLSSLAVPSLLKFVLIGSIALPLCFGLGHVLHQLPLLRRVL